MEAQTELDGDKWSVTYAPLGATRLLKSTMVLISNTHYCHSSNCTF